MDSQSRRPFAFSTAEEDACRRDFTINSLAVALHGERHGELVDFFGGRKDLQRRDIRVLHSLSFIDDHAVEVVTGVNLPMLIKLASIRDQELTLAEVADRLTVAGQKSIRVASEFLRSRSARACSAYSRTRPPASSPRSPAAARSCWPA